MEEILASIRRILNEDDPPQPAAPPPEEDVLVLDNSMMVSPPRQPEGHVDATPEAHKAEVETAPAHEAHAQMADEPAEPQDAVTRHAPVTTEPVLDTPEPSPSMTEAPAVAPPPVQAVSEPDVAMRAEAAPAEPQTPAPATDPAAQLVAPEAAAAAAYALGSLVRTLAADRKPAVWSSGPTLEDLVRAELRPMLKAWLDANLPPVVERLVRAEIERVVGRAIP